MEITVRIRPKSFEVTVKDDGRTATHKWEATNTGAQGEFKNDWEDEELIGCFPDLVDALRDLENASFEVMNILGVIA